MPWFLINLFSNLNRSLVCEVEVSKHEVDFFLNKPLFSYTASGQKNMPAIENDLIKDGEFYQKSRKLAIYVILKHQSQTQPKDSMGDKLYELCLDVKYKHDLFFENVGNELGLNEQNFEQLSQAVMSEVLSGNCNFGRVVSIYAFSLALSDYCVRNSFGNRTESIAKTVALTIQAHIEWFNKNGSWVRNFLILKLVHCMTFYRETFYDFIF